MFLEDAIRLRINYFMSKKGFSSLWELYKNTGIPKSTIISLLGNNSTNSLPRIPTLLHICEGLDTNLKDFFNDDIFLEVMDSKDEITK